MREDGFSLKEDGAMDEGRMAIERGLREAAMTTGGTIGHPHAAGRPRLSCRLEQEPEPKRAPDPAGVMRPAVFVPQTDIVAQPAADRRPAAAASRSA